MIAKESKVKRSQRDKTIITHNRLYTEKKNAPLTRHYHKFEGSESTCELLNINCVRIWGDEAWMG